MARFNISERQVDDTTIFDLSGDLTFGEGNLELRRVIRGALSEGKNKIALDFGNVCYIDSSGIGELVSALIALNREDGRLRLQNLSPRVKELLNICKLMIIFDVCENDAEAASGTV